MPGRSQVSLDGFRVASHFGRSSVAEDRLREVISLVPNNAAGYYNLGLLLADAGRAAEAVPPLAEAVRRAGPALEPGAGALVTHRAVEVLALLHLDAGRFQDAAAVLKPALNSLVGAGQHFYLAPFLHSWMCKPRPPSTVVASKNTTDVCVFV